MDEAWQRSGWRSRRVPQRAVTNATFIEDSCTCICICICVCPAHTDTDTGPSKKHTCSLSFPEESWRGALSGTANDQRNSGTCWSQLAFKRSIGRIKRLFGGIVVQVLTPFSFQSCFCGFFFVSVLCFSLVLSPPYRSHAPVCRSQHTTCVHSKRLRVYMWTFYRYTGRRFECIHGGVRNPHTVYSTFFFFF